MDSMASSSKLFSKSTDKFLNSPLFRAKPEWISDGKVQDTTGDIVFEVEF